MLARDPFRHVGPYGNAHRESGRGLLPLGNGWAVLGGVLGSLAILAGLLLAVGAIGR